MNTNGHPGWQKPGWEETTAKIAYLVSGYIRSTLTQAEHDELDEWINASDENMKLFEELTDENNIEQNLAWLDQLNVEKAAQGVKEKISFSTESRSSSVKIKWWRWAAAAAVIITAVILVDRIKTAKSKTEVPVEIVQDVQPGGNKAILILSDDRVINLSDAKDGLLQTDRGTEITKTSDGELSYTATGAAESAFNTIKTPKGGQYMITLSDGTKVWLNAESSLKYPLHFSGNQRRVEIEGEGYFEVAKDAAKPFKVILKDSTEVEVLGTHFNIMSYGDEPTQKITLLEGSIKLTARSSQLAANSSPLASHGSPLTAILKPGDQAVLTHSSKLITLNSPDTDEVIGWKNGQFIFHNDPIADIMRQVKRWYDVEVMYQIDSSEHFNATIARDQPVSKLLHYLEGTNRIHFKIQNRTIYVLR